ncbi:MAG: GAF domain-containing protein [Chloroflexi bacterium]|nr:GAF domain-containing protein [Chloroflexota bacterium]
MTATDFPDTVATQTLQAMSDAVIAVDAQGLIRFANSNAEILTGYSNHELVRQGVDILVPASKRGAHSRERTKYSAAPSRREMGVRQALELRRKDGSLLPVVISLAPLDDQESGIVLSTVRDVSDLERRSKEDLLLAEIGALVSREHQIDSVYDLLAKSLPDLIAFDRLVVSVKLPNIDLVEKVFASGVEIPGNRVGKREVAPILPRVSPTSNSPAVESNKNHKVDQLLANAGLRSWVEVALGDPASPSGILSLRSTTEFAYNDEDMFLLGRVASRISPAFEIARLYAQAQNEARERTVLAELSRIITSTSDIQKVYDLATELVRELIPFDRIVITTIDRSRNLATDRYVAGLQIPGGEVGASLPLDQSLTGELVKVPGPRFFSGNEANELATLYPGDQDRIKAGLMSLVAAPLIWDDEAIGMLLLRSKHENAYGESDAANAMKIANQISGAVASAESLASTRKDSDEKAALAEISRIVSSSLVLKEVYERFVAVARRLIAADRVVISLIDLDGDTIIDEYVWGVEFPSHPEGGSVRFSETSGPEMTFDGSTVIWGEEEIRADAQKRGVTPISDRAGLRSLLMVPFIWRDELIGTINFRSKSADRYSPDSARIAEQIASQVVGVLATSRAHARSLASERAQMASEAREQELERVNDARSAFLSTVSHELRTPLTSIVAFGDVLSRNLDSNLTARQLKQLEIIRRSARRLDVLINDLLDVSRLNAGSFSLTKQEFDVKLLIEELRSAFSPILEDKNQSLVVNFPPADIWIDADRDRIAQLITNLLSNSSKYSYPATEIMLKCSVVNDSLFLSVADRGIGMSEESQAAIYTPFFRSEDEYTQSESGTGLGLVIVKSLVDLHDGTISIRSEHGIGTTVELFLPGCTGGPSEAYLKLLEEASVKRVPRSRLDELPSL